MQFAGESNPSTQPRNAQFSKKFHFWLDEPADWSRRVRWLRISGWCVTKGDQPVTAIRGTLRGRAFEGRFDRARPEVAAYTGVLNAPRWCGFTIDLEVPFGKGRLELQVAGPDNPWQRFFAADVHGPLFPNGTAPRNAQFSKKFHFWLDEPADWSRPVRWLRLSGWCVTQGGQPLTAIRARLRGKTFEGRFDRERTEVAAETGVPNAPRWCGFTLDVEVPFGKGRLQVQVAGPHDPWRKAFAADVRGPLFPHARERQQHLETTLAEAPSRYHFWFDRPARWDEPASTLFIIGWCLDRRGGWIHGIRARIGSKKFEGKYGISRTDIPLMHPDLPAAARSGFALVVPLPKGRSEILLELMSVDHHWHPFFRHPVVGKSETGHGESIHPGEADHFLSTTPPAPFAIWCDQPSDWEKPAVHLRISGWCVTTYGEPIIELRGRVGGHVFSANYGAPRPDIALAFEDRPNALRSGFSAEVTVPQGGGNFVLEGRGQDGVWKQIFSRRLGHPSEQAGG